MTYMADVQYQQQSAGLAKPGALPGVGQKATTFPDPAADAASPKRIVGGEQFKYWAESNAENLKAAVDQNSSCVVAANGTKASGSSSGGSNAATEAEVAAVTRRICRQLAKQISDDVYADLVGALRGKMRVVEDACQAAHWQAGGGGGASTESGDSTNSPSANSDPSDVVVGRIDELLSRRVPQELTRCLAKEIFAQLVDETPDSAREAPSGNAADLAVSGFPATTGGGGSSPERAAAAVAEAAATAAAPRAAPADVHRKFYQDNRDAALQLDAFKKFKLVLVDGRGFRVVKHNHGGGRKTRILKYNPSKNRLYWESARVLGGEYVDCSTLLRVNREEAVTYVWHTTGAKPGSGAKKMVGFETQREYDARVLELALLHLLAQTPGAQGR